MAGLIVEVVSRCDGSYQAHCPSEGFSIGGLNLAELYGNLTQVIEERFEGREKPSPSRVRLLVTRE